MRSTWTSLTDAELLAQCDVDTYRASGPGGQKRNKTSSAVRLRHRPSGLMVIAEESRSQHENKARAVERLRRAFVLELREPIDANPATIADHPDYRDARSPDGRLHLSARNPRFWPAAGVVLDVLESTGAALAEAAVLLGLSTANLVDFLRTDPKLWQQANGLRGRFGRKPLK